MFDYLSLEDFEYKSITSLTNKDIYELVDKVLLEKSKTKILKVGRNEQEQYIYVKFRTYKWEGIERGGIIDDEVCISFEDIDSDFPFDDEEITEAYKWLFKKLEFKIKE